MYVCAMRFVLCLVLVMVCVNLVQGIQQQTGAALTRAEAPRPQTVAERNVELAQKWMAMDGDAIMEVVWEQERHMGRDVAQQASATPAATSRVSEETPAEKTITADGVVVALTSHHPAHRQLPETTAAAAAVKQDSRAQKTARLCRQYMADLLVNDIDALSAATDYSALAHCLHAMHGNTPAAMTAVDTTQDMQRDLQPLRHADCVFNMNHSCLAVPASLGNYPASHDETRGTLAVALAALILAVTLFMFIF